MTKKDHKKFWGINIDFFLTEELFWNFFGAQVKMPCPRAPAPLVTPLAIIGWFRERWDTVENRKDFFTLVEFDDLNFLLQNNAPMVSRSCL